MMGRGHRLATLAATAVAAFASSCDSRECTDIGCLEGVFLTLDTTDGSWQAGSYSITLTIADRTHDCAFELPTAFPPTPGQVAIIPCSNSLSLHVNSHLECIETRTEDTISIGCTPIADRWYVTATISGTPAELGVQVTRDGVPLLEDARSLTYEESHPNGPECGPGCRQATVELKLE